MTNNIEYLINRVRYLEKENYATLYILDVLSKFNLTILSLEASKGPDDIFAIMRKSLGDLNIFKLFAFMLPGKKEYDFDYILCEPEQEKSYLKKEVEWAIKEDFFAWALKQNCPSFRKAKKIKDQLFMQPLIVEEKVFGMFVCIVDDLSFSKNEILITDVVSNITNTCSRAVERYRLEGKIIARTKELEKVNEDLKNEIKEKEKISSLLDAERINIENTIESKTEYLQEMNAQLEFKVKSSKKTEIKLKESLSEKDLLLREIHHRVKNNLQIISSLLYLQSNKVRQSECVKLFHESQNRIRSMALIHEKLYQSKDISRINLRDYLNSLTAELVQSCQSGNLISLELDLENLLLSVEKALPIGLIVNELFSNSLKYAFPEFKKGIISISMKRFDTDKYILNYNDNGIGLPDGFDLNMHSSLGLRLVSNLVKQLDGELEISSNNGAHFGILF